jgi:hypothetical protein
MISDLLKAAVESGALLFSVYAVFSAIDIDFESPFIPAPKEGVGIAVPRGTVSERRESGFKGRAGKARQLAVRVEKLFVAAYCAPVSVSLVQSKYEHPG